MNEELKIIRSNKKKKKKNENHATTVICMLIITILNLVFNGEALSTDH
jgi:hypothetical protein